MRNYVDELPEDTFESEVKPLAVLYRILGNDLPPRHDERQTLQNLEFILKNEPSHDGLERAWLVNRIFCAETERRIIDLLDGVAERYIRLPFELDEYARLAPDFSHFEPDDFAVLWSGEVPHGYRRILAHDHAYHAQNCYLMNVNGARNVAIRDGLSRAAWVLPWDGNCFLTADAWSELRKACELQAEDCRYLIVPMERLLNNADLLDAKSSFPALEEPQVGVRCGATEWFDENLRYGRFSKVELLRRLGVPGVWDSWDFQEWEARSWKVSSEQPPWRYCGWTARLASGQPDFDKDASAAGIRHRSFARRASIRAGVARADRALVSRAMSRCPSFIELSAMDVCRLRWVQDSARAPELTQLITRAEAALLHPLRTVLHKTVCATDGDWRTYHSVAPFWWPDTSGDNLPYVRRDGQRVSEAELGNAASLGYDATRMQGVFDDVFVLAWASYVTGRGDFADKAAAVVEAWFVNEETSMHPNLNFAQVRRGRQRIGGHASGIIEARDIYLLIGGVTILRQMSRLPSELVKRFRDWCANYLAWLLHSPLGSTERSGKNNHGTCYEIQVLSLSLFLERSDIFVDAAARARSRVFQQFRENGTQPEEEQRRTPLHYSMFNLQSWMIVARLLECGGLVLVARGGRGEARLAASVEALKSNVMNWRAQIAAVELWPPVVANRLGVRLDAIVGGAAHFGLTSPVRRRFSLRSIWPHPHAGTPPLWPLAFPRL